MCKISIIMPVHHAEKYLERSIRSIQKQTMDDIELICVDDASKDHSIDILQQYAQQDGRIRIIRFDRNKSALQARKAGAEAACGEYILFLDADDYYEAAACEELYRLMEREGTQILHFDSVIENCGTTDEWVLEMERFVMPYQGKLYGKDVFEECFLLERYHFNLWNKMFEAAFLKKAFSDLPDGAFPKANDLLAYFVLAYHAKSYSGVHTPGYYHYQFGSGSTGSTNLSLEQFHRLNQEADVVRACRQVLERYHAAGEYQKALDRLKKRLLDECLFHWIEYTDLSLGAEAFDDLAAAWGINDVAESVIKQYSHRKIELAEKIAGAECLKHKKKQISTLGMFYHWMAKGGVQRVISLLIPMYLEMGYQIVLFTEEIDLENEYPLPAGIKRVLLPESIRLRDCDYMERGKVLKEELKKNEVDVLLYHAASSEKLFFDALIAKSLGIPFVVTVHELFSQNMVYRDDSSRKKISTYQIVDRLVVLSKAEQMYWSALGIPAVYISNPVELIEAVPGSGGYILWLGRLDQTQKQYMDAVEIMYWVVKKIPGAKLKIVGNQVNPNAVQRIMHRVKALGLEHNVEVCGFTKNVGEYYKDAEVFLMTSAYESFPMTVMESKLWHLPLVVYDMPYLELLKDQKGCISVPQGDVKKAAEEIVMLLSDAGLRKRMAQEAYGSIRRFAEYDLKDDWEKVFQDILLYKNDSKQDETIRKEDVGLLLRTMVFHYTKGIYAADEPSDRLLRWMRRAENWYLYCKENGIKASLAAAGRKIFNKG